MIRLALLFLVACDFSLPSQEPAPEGPLDLGAQPARERTPILPGILSNPIPAPEPGLSRSQCNELQSGGPTEGCITGEIHCGETVVGHTRGGVKVFDTAFYEAKFCTPATTEHAGGDERVYRFKMPEGKYTAVATLDTPCADLDLAAIAKGTARDEAIAGTRRCQHVSRGASRSTSQPEVRTPTKVGAAWQSASSDPAREASRS